METAAIQSFQTTTTTSHLDNITTSSSSSSDHPQTIKMEDLEQSMFQQPSTAASTPSPSFLDLDSPAETPRSSESRPVKKRKSWGQVLPEPKTNLPPRKRAKTADEKEQRRIERVKRNRLAAHNSRERKRQEVDALQAEKAALEERVAAMEAELFQYRQLLPTANIPKAAELQPPNFDLLDAYNDSIMAPTQTPFESPDSLLSTMDSPVDSAPSTPRNEMIKNEPDLTQHSAVSVGYQQLDHFDAKSSVAGGLPHQLQYPELHDDDSFNGLFDFALFPEGGNGMVGNTESFFDSSFESAAPNTALNGNPSDLLDQFGANLFDLQPSAGATLAVSDARGIAAESV